MSLKRDICCGVAGGVIASALWAIILEVVMPHLPDWRPPLAPEKPITIEMDGSISACRSGDISKYVERAKGEDLIEFPNGADHTVICGDYKYTGLERELWRGLDEYYKSCFAFWTGGPNRFYVVTDSGAVCKTPFIREGSRLVKRLSERNIYLCIGALGKAKFRRNVYNQPQEPRDCAPDELMQFKFSVGEE